MTSHGLLLLRVCYGSACAAASARVAQRERFTQGAALVAPGDHLLSCRAAWTLPTITRYITAGPTLSVVGVHAAGGCVLLYLIFNCDGSARKEREPYTETATRGAHLGPG